LTTEVRAYLLREVPFVGSYGMRNIRLIVAYDGTDFHGWQRQPDVLTVQECLEAAIEKVIGEECSAWGSGRTDAGVHALNQVANFKTNCPIPCANLLKALNDVLPRTVRVRDAREVPERFHARYDVRSKTYRYRILQAPICSPFLWRFVCHHPYPLDRQAMAQAARLIEGEHDFTSFASVDAPGREAGGQGPAHGPEGTEKGRRPGSANMVRRLFTSRVLWRPRTSMLIYEVRGSGFLHHMVRNIVGTLIEVGRGRLVPLDVVRILETRDRTLAGPTAPAQGLCLVAVEY
jgi:tRNA pseudouridine38-40 synthase